MQEQTSRRATPPALWHRHFLAHPHAVNETYGQHFLASGRFCLILLRLAACAALHAVFPSLCEKTVSTRIVALADKMKTRQS